MKVVSTVDELKQMVNRFKLNGQNIGLVPTMGYLHEGHLSLVDICKEQADVVILTIFVNPTQFGPNEDLESYPRNLERDLNLCKERGVDLVFCPTKDEVYNPSHSTWVDEDLASLGLCGNSRPGHFRGVLTICSKLFNLTQCNVAVFGQKDAQQVTLIEKMVNDLNMNLSIIRAPIAREKDGLAMSSRNSYLLENERKVAPTLQKALKLASELISNGENDPVLIKNKMQNLISEEPLFKIDYLEIVDRINLQPVKKISNGEVLLAAAVFLGKTRLIDNLEA